MNNKLRDIINDYLKDDYADIADLDEDLMDDSFDEDFDEEEEIDTVIQDITNLYNESDEETQAIIDILIEEEDGIETLVNSMYGLEEEEDELDEGIIKNIVRKITKKDPNEETELTELSKDVLARYAKKAAVNIRTKSNIHHGFEDIKADITKVIVKNSPYSSPHSKHDRDPDALKHASKQHEVISDMIKDNQHKQNNRIEGIGRAVVKLAKATAPKSKNPGPTIDQPSKLGLANPKAFAKLEKILAPASKNPGPTIPTKKTKKLGYRSV